MLSALHTTSYDTSELPQHCGQGGDLPILAGTTPTQAIHIRIPMQERMQGEGRPGEALILTGIPVPTLMV
jgi:hypothetical protein